MNTEPTQAQLDAFLIRAGFSYGWENLESSARRMVEHACYEQAELRAKLEAQPSQAQEPTEAQLVAGVRAMRLFVTKNSIKDFRDGFIAAINAKGEV